eukprot:CAMPEP_0197586008 /NCGR_PEP_ID=MMETSP1326-20131121/8130_1 /TAXON_ID=1155430 /ORGANISM="Genus nov. species nov., Strain RCC2288" /LENGTH=140 /DNA_ID=CAMNT_0043150589 /DNA_START=100 /DNA_END=522 /DNA_ORIENTATION=+
MTAAEVEERPKTSGKKAVPSELEDWAKKKVAAGSPVSSPKAQASPAAEARVSVPMKFKMGLPEESSKSLARMKSGDRNVTGGFFTGVSCQSGQHTGVFHKPCSESDPTLPKPVPVSASHFQQVVGGKRITGEGKVAAGLH